MARTAAVLAQWTCFLSSFSFVGDMLSVALLWHFRMHDGWDRGASNRSSTSWSRWNIDTISRGSSSYHFVTHSQRRLCTWGWGNNFAESPLSFFSLSAPFFKYVESTWLCAAWLVSSSCSELACRMISLERWDCHHSGSPIQGTSPAHQNFRFSPHIPW